MTIAITHTKISGIGDSGNTSLIQPSDWNAGLTTSMATGKLLGRTTASAGIFEEITPGTGLGLASGNLTLSGGKQTIWIPAGAMTSKVTNGAGFTTYDSGTSDVTLLTGAFDTTTQEYLHFSVAMPKSWNAGTVTFIPYWTNQAGATTQTLVMSLAGRAQTDNDTLNGAFGTVQTSTDTWLAQNVLQIGPESAAITIGNTPAQNDLIIFELSRVVASDTMAGDALIIGIKLLITTNTGDDS